MEISPLSFIDDPDSPTSRRKNEILNQAQEFADLKKQCEEVLPYNAHKATLLSDRWEFYSVIGRHFNHMIEKYD